MKHGKRQALFIVLILICGLSCYAYIARASIYEELNNLKLIPAPEDFTELYFENSSNLPTKTVANQPMSFSFTIHNVEATTTVYPYEVYFEDPTGYKVDLATGTVTLANDASTTIPISYTFQASNLTGEVVVNLPSLNNQSIDFLLPDNN